MLDHDELPNGWAPARLGDLAEYVNGRGFKTTEWETSGKPIIRIQNLTKENSSYNYTQQEFPNKYAIKRGDLLFSWSASLGVYLWGGGDAWLNQHIFNVVPKKTTSKLFVYYLLKKITTELYSKAHGSGMVHVTKGKFEDTKIQLPPLKEQYRIVEKIEELFSELDSGIENLKLAQERLKAYRHALLKYAFEGQLTALVREENKDTLETTEAMLKRIQLERQESYQQEIALWESKGKVGGKPRPLKPLPPLDNKELEGLPEVPGGWCWIRLGEVFIQSPKNGLYKPSNFYGSGSKIIRIDDFYDGELLKNKVFKRVTITEAEAKDFGLAIGDILVNRVNSIEYLGKCCEVLELAEPIIFESNIMKLTLSPNLAVNAYITLYLSSYFGRQRLCVNAKHAVNQASINQVDVAMTPIPFTSLNCQIIVTNFLAQQLSLVKKLANEIDLGLSKASSLRQAVLQKAFSGQLVPQDPNDEPASELLARIKTEVAKSKPPNKKKA